MYVLTMLVWGAGFDAAPTVHYWIGRCKEKSGPYSLSAWKFAMESLCDLSAVKDIVWWSDVGRHFRANLPIATMCTQGIKSLCDRSLVEDHPHGMSLCFGLPSHFKNHADGAQAALKGLLAEVCKQRTISTIEDMIKFCRLKYEEYVADPSRKPRMKSVFHPYFRLCRDLTSSETTATNFTAARSENR